jgi:hypothetical protein
MDNEADGKGRVAEDVDKSDRGAQDEGPPNDGELFKGTKLPDKD